MPNSGPACGECCATIFDRNRDAAPIRSDDPARVRYSRHRRPILDDGRLVRARGVVEKPEPARAPSTSTIIGRYIIQPEVFAHLSRAEAGSGGEIQLTDALARAIDDGQPFHGFRFSGRRFDCGDKLGYLEATLALGLAHAELGPGLRRVLRNYL